MATEERFLVSFVHGEFPAIRFSLLSSAFCHVMRNEA